MNFAHLLRTSRRAAGLTQVGLAELTGIARPNIAAYEAGRRQPLFATAEVLLRASGATWSVDPPIRWQWSDTRRPYAVPSRLWRLPIEQALRSVNFEEHRWWSGPVRGFDLSDRRQRLRAYEIVLREGGPEDIVSIVDGLLLCELWPQLVLPNELRDAWNPLIARALESQDGGLDAPQRRGGLIEGEPFADRVDELLDGFGGI